MIDILTTAFLIYTTLAIGFIAYSIHKKPTVTKINKDYSSFFTKLRNLIDQELK